MRILDDLKPHKVFSFFEDICAIPHGSGNTEAISAYCVRFAEERGLDVIRDRFNNVLIRKPGSRGYEDHPPVILQGHLDMVCEKDPGVIIDFEKDGLRLCTDGEIVYAEGTTLGGDDGIAVAMALAVLDDDVLPHPPLEVLFTTDEEMGMDGALGFDGSLLTSRTLLNIDSENEGVLTVGCAGGARADLTLPMKREEAEDQTWLIVVDGLIGGHSGVEIDKGRQNADLVLAKFLNKLPFEFRLVDIAGGQKDNAIPSLAYCVIVANEDPTDVATNFVSLEKTEEDPGLKITITPGETAVSAFDRRSTQCGVDLLCALPNGVQSMSRDIDGLVQTSLNLGILYCKDKELYMSFSVRSSLSREKNDLLNQLRKIAETFGADFRSHGDYPAWEYRPVSPLREIMISTYESLYGQKPRIEVIHAGLECGLLGEKLPGLDAVSFGPDLFDIHTPRERMAVASVERTYHYLCAVLKEL